MMTRRGFFGALAALAASRVAPVPVAAAVPERWTFRGVPICWDNEPRHDDALDAARHLRRDDGDTILELR